MNHYDVVFSLFNEEKISVTFCQYDRERLEKAIQMRLGTLKYWEIQLEEGSVGLITDQVVSYTISKGTECINDETETEVFTFPALIYAEKFEHSSSHSYTLVFPDIEIISGGDTFGECLYNGKEFLNRHLKVELENNEVQLRANSYFQNPSSSKEQALERHHEQMPEFYDDSISDFIELVHYMDITTNVEIVRDEWKYFLNDMRIK